MTDRPEEAPPTEPLCPPGAIHSPPYQNESTGLKIILSYWLVLLLGVPFWWWTTSIERLALPRARVEKLSEMRDNLRFPVTIAIDSASHFDGPVLQGSLNQKFQMNSLLRQLLNVSILSQPRDAYDHRSAYSLQILAPSASYSSSKPKFEVEGRTLRVLPNDDVALPAFTAELADVVSKLLLPPSDDAYKLRVAQYAPRYRLAFSLLNEDASIGGGAMTWDIEQALRRHIQPTLDDLSVLHNFTIESQVQYHAPLAFEPQPLDTESKAWALGDDELKVFVNSAEWTLASSTTNDPVLHFLLFVPAMNRSPLRILDSAGQVTDSTAFIVPQWGGIVVLNMAPGANPTELSASDLETPFSYFNTQLRALLGVPPLPEGVAASSHGTSTWQLDSLLRHRSLENVRSSIDTTDSIIKLVDRIKGMPVGTSVTSDFDVALQALTEVQATALTSDPATTLLSTARAFVHSSAAFFNPTMVAMLYFPTEHKYAVYTPLFAPVAVPLIVALLREGKALIARRKAGKLKTA